MELDIDTSVKPVIQGLRAVPYHMEKVTDTEIKKLEKEDIIEKVDSATTWCSPLHVQLKDDGTARVCVDLRAPNKQVKRIRYPIPTPEDVSHKIKDAKIFSKVDLTKGYHQLELHKNSRDITTFRYQNVIGSLLREVHPRQQKNVGIYRESNDQRCARQ